MGNVPPIPRPMAEIGRTVGMALFGNFYEFVFLPFDFDELLDGFFGFFRKSGFFQDSVNDFSFSFPLSASDGFFFFGGFFPRASTCEKVVFPRKYEFARY